MSDCRWVRQRKWESLVLGAFKQAAEEAGIADHPGGECPAPDCRCEQVAEWVEARAVQIIEAALGHPLPEATP